MNNNFCTIYIVRHGQSEANVEDIYGLDTPLTAKGIQQAEKLAQKFKEKSLDAIFSSDFLRAQKTAEIIAQYHNLPVLTKKSLREKYLGSLEGKLVKDVKNELKVLFDKRKTLPYAQWKSIRLAPDAETDEEMIERFLVALKEIAVANKTKTILLASHVGLMKTLLIHLGFATHKALDGQAFANTGYIKLKTDGKEFLIEELKGIRKKK